METITQHETDLDRRRFLAGAALTAGVWVAPSVLTVDRAFGTPGSPMCVNSAYDFTVVTTGPVSSTTGPVSSCSQSGTDTLTAFSITVPTFGTLGGGSGFTAECSDTTGCAASAEIAELAVDLTTLAGMPVTLNATTIRADASCAGGTSTRTVTIVNGQLTVGATTIPLDASPGPNTVVFDSTAAMGPVQLLVVLNEQTGAGTVNAIHISLTVTDPLTPSIPPQTVDIVIASATATC